MKRMNTLSHLLILVLILFGMVISLVSCETAYNDLAEQIREQNPQFTLPKASGEVFEKSTGETTDEEQSEKTPEIITTPVPRDPCWNGHEVVVDPAVKPTCTTPGKTEGTHCVQCSKVLVKQTVVSATGHSSSGWTTVYRDDPLGTEMIVAKRRYCLTCKEELDRISFTSVEVFSSFDNDGDGAVDAYTFSNYLPERFLSRNAILINGASHLETDLGVRTAERIKDSGIWHYYLDLSPSDIPDEAKSLTWKFEVFEPGAYEICFDLGMKDAPEQRGIVMQIDDGEKRYMDYVVTPEFAEVIRDETHGSYMTGFSVELTAGEHVMQMKYNPICPKTFHFRNIYLVKVA